MSFLYELAVLGSPTPDQIRELEKFVSQALNHYGLQLGTDVAWQICPAKFTPNQLRASAAIFFGGKGVPHSNIQDLLREAIPVIPVASEPGKVSEEIPDPLRPFNCLFHNTDGIFRIATALLECASLLPRQRRVFVSYRRDEAKQAALQLFDELSSKLFDVFLDTHGISPADDFQAVLWHRLCDSDVLVMLDTPNYFASRWTNAEFGRALAKGISVLRVGWPGGTASPRTATASHINLSAGEIDISTGRMESSAIKRICLQLEEVRSKSHAVRHLNLVSNLRNGIDLIQGSVVGVGIRKAVFIKLADGRDIVVYPTVGVPTSAALHDAFTSTPSGSVAVLFDPVGLHPGWLDHLDWLGKQVLSPKWVKSTEAAWQFAGWGT